MTAGRFAHKPRCEATQARLLRVGRTDVCRGCACLWAGVVLGAIVAITGIVGAIAGLASLLLGLAGLRPAWYAAFPNALRDGARFALGAGPLVFLAGSCRAGYWYPALATLWVAGVIALRAMRARRARLA